MKKVLAAMLMVLGVIFAPLLMPAAHAATPAVTASTNSISELTLSATTVQLLLGLLMPIVVGLLTKFGTSSGVKALVMLILNSVQTLIVQATMADGTAIISKQTFIAWVMVLIVSVASYAGVYRPLNITSSTEGGKLAPKRGLF